jgi:ribosomal protein S27AE
MVVHSYIDNSSNHTPTNTYYRDSPMSGRSPVKNIAFSRRTLHSKKKYCVCGRALVWFKEGECWSCTECGYTQYLEQKQQQPEQQGIGGVMSVDGLSDVRSTPNRGAMKFRSKDPRSRFLKPRSQLDPELQRLVDEQGVTVQRYEERIEESSEVLSQEELRQSK